MSKKSNKRILFVTSFWPYPNNDGGRNVAIAILEALNKYYHVDIVAYVQEPVFDPHKANLTHYKASQIRLVRFSRAPKWHIIKYWLQGKSYYFYRDFTDAYLKALLELLEQNNYDTVVVDRTVPLVFIPHIRQKASRLIFFAHNVESDLIKDFILQGQSGVKRILKTPLWIEYWFAKSFEKQVLNMFDNVYSISLADAEKFRSWGVEKVQVYPPAFFEAKSLPVKSLAAERKLKPYVKLLSNFKWYPNAEGILWFAKKVWPLVLRRVPDAKLLLGGKSFAPGVARKLLEISGIELLGYIPPEEVDSFYADAALSIAPILSGSGLKIKVLRALQYGIPLVATTKSLNGFSRDLLALIPHSDQPDVFAEEIIKLLKSPNKRFKLRQNLYEYFLQHMDRKVLDKFMVNIIENGAEP